jgi:hypothetical protein
VGRTTPKILLCSQVVKGKIAFENYHKNYHKNLDFPCTIAYNPARLKTF